MPQPGAIPAFAALQPALQHPPRKRRSRLPVLVVLVALLVAGVAASPTIAAKLSGDAEQDEAIATATTGPPTTAPAPSTTPVPTTVATTIPPTTTIPVAQGAFPIQEEIDALVEQQELCRREFGKVFASLQAFVWETGAHPDDPDGLARIGWLEEHPDGWNSRWYFDYSEAGIAVVAVPGTACDGVTVW